MILIDMPMPTGCEDCPMREEIYGECVLLKRFVDGFDAIRDPDCPLREVTEHAELWEVK